ncbi:hypothetical protein COCCADRAFT_25099 [Bipolaris zeicola 26-R-13]|uniref:Uncharacterized protein n=1 Tax=Cochliobolus carbonum (strain 26-R-13) TaxID=930089 RepID=W6Y5R7_COCC2|nr:uncharacterized protein COCCADRAFT_25099 [Bipolaris zeicola 26-R-13]EUC34867.1 hypothetical protein COCCADRAFT_25099 [Bipolaris zeicola 26-R-13]
MSDGLRVPSGNATRFHASRLLIEAGVSATCRIVHKSFTGFRTLQLNNHPRGDESRQKRRVKTHRSCPYATGNARHNQGHAPTATAEGPIERGGARQHPHWNQVQPDKAHPDYDPACVASDTIVTQKRLEREPNSVWHPANLASMIWSWGRVVEQ